MCHGKPSSRFPTPNEGAPFEGALHGFSFGQEGSPRLAILPDIYGCNPFYKGLATYFAGQGLHVYLMNPFHALGALPEMTREAAFERRHKLRDRAYVEALEAFLEREEIGGVLGFCLGGLYIFELARRGYSGRMVAFYPFPQGLPNDDPLQVPFEYLDGVSAKHSVLIGNNDPSLGPEVTANLCAVAAKNPAIDLHVFEGSGHGFLADLDSDDAAKRANAEAAFAIAETVLAPEFT
ncbi:dienelactone hydrolase family protein [Algihabitans albus]|uniref:dienelactone hydrolase family protein n=1 Tax=Algihabitans albus TaxID=2164067 RepID=UPI000E5C7765|nr:dienelactone hydrolase family protein [Algihabitans albus]